MSFEFFLKNLRLLQNYNSQSAFHLGVLMMMSLELVDVVLTTIKQPKMKNITMSSLKLVVTFVTHYKQNMIE
jgi:hypothetical protein